MVSFLFCLLQTLTIKLLNEMPDVKGRFIMDVRATLLDCTDFVSHDVEVHSTHSALLSLVLINNHQLTLIY